MQDQGSSRVIAESTTEDHIVVAQATDSSPPRELVPEGALEATTGTDSARPRIEIPADYLVPGAGERVVAEVPEGGEVVLLDSRFDPRVATYSVDGQHLVVTLADGGVLILENFFLAGANPAALALLDGPAVPATDLLLQAETFVAQNDPGAIQPAAGNEGGTGGKTGGGANFSPYDPGVIGPGLDPLGPLGPTELGRMVALDDEPVVPTEDDGLGGGILPPPVSPPPPVGPPPPTVSPPPPVGPPPPTVSPPPPVGPPPPPVGPPPPPVGPPPPPVGPPPPPVGPPPPVAPPPPPTTSGEAPRVTLRADIEAAVAEQSVGFNPPSTPRLPINGDGSTVADGDINGIDQNALCLDTEREVFVRFVDETSRSIDSLFVHVIDADGTMSAIRPVFPFVNKPGDVHEPADLVPGTEVSIGVFPAGAKINFFLVNDGGRKIDAELFESGRFELRNATTGEPAKITDDDPPILVHVAEDGTETIVNTHILFGADDSQRTTNNNDLNADGEGHVVSGWDDGSGSLVFGFEDDIRPTKDNDFDDDVFAVRFGSVTERFAFLIGDEATAGLGARITDADSTQLSTARVVLDTTFDGDMLVLDPALLADTGIRVVFQTDTDIRLEGAADIAVYEQIISSIRLEVGEGDIAGTREIWTHVRDTDGNISNKARTTIDLEDKLILGDDGDNILDGISRSGEPNPADGDDTISGRGGNDVIDGRSGNDFLDGGDGDDIIMGSGGNDILNGGAGRDRLIGGRGADEFRYTGLSDGTDTIVDFNADQGDVLGLHLLLDGSGFDPDAPNAGRFLRLRELDLDGDGARDDIQVQVDLDGAGSAHRFVTIFELLDPVGVDATTDPLAIASASPDGTVV